MNSPQRKPIRLPTWNYSNSAYYFVTVVTHGRECIFGSVKNDKMTRSPAGNMVRYWWSQLEKRFPQVKLDEYIVMPNHVHGIIQICGDDHEDSFPMPGTIVNTAVGADLVSARASGDILHGRVDRADIKSAPTTLFRVMQSFKSITTLHYIRGVEKYGWPAFDGKVWQRSYYDHIVRNQDNLNRIREYIQNNSMNWQNDSFHPQP